MRTLAALSALLLVAACQAPPAEMTEAERAQIEAEVRTFAEGFLEAFPELNASRLKAAFAHDGFSFVINAVRFSREDWDNLIDEVTSDWISMEAAWDSMDIRVLSQDAAVFEGQFHTRRIEGDGTVLAFPVGFWSALCERRDGEWRWVMIHQSYPDPIVEEG